jgi:hypothetical protein
MGLGCGLYRRVPESMELGWGVAPWPGAHRFHIEWKALQWVCNSTVAAQLTPR